MEVRCQLGGVLARRIESMLCPCKHFLSLDTLHDMPTTQSKLPDVSFETKLAYALGQIRDLSTHAFSLSYTRSTQLHSLRVQGPSSKYDSTSDQLHLASSLASNSYLTILPNAPSTLLFRILTSLISHAPTPYLEHPPIIIVRCAQSPSNSSLLTIR